MSEGYVLLTEGFKNIGCHKKQRRPPLLCADPLGRRVSARLENTLAHSRRWGVQLRDWHTKNGVVACGAASTSP